MESPKGRWLVAMRCFPRAQESKAWSPASCTVRRCFRFSKVKLSCRKSGHLMLCSWRLHCVPFYSVYQEWAHFPSAKIALSCFGPTAHGLKWWSRWNLSVFKWFLLGIMSWWQKGDLDNWWSSSALTPQGMVLPGSTKPYDSKVLITIQKIKVWLMQA